MSQTTINLTVKEGGVATDMTSVQFGDPTGTLGVVRTDTNANVIPPGTPLAHSVGVGNYSYGPFTDPAPNLVYRYYLTVLTLAGLTLYTSDTIAAGTVGGTATGDGYYTSQSLIEQRFGQYNADLASNRGDGSSTAPDPAGFSSAVNEVDSYINWKASENGYTTPIPTTIANWLRLQIIATKLGEALLYVNARGVHDDDNVGKAMDAQRMQAIAEIDEFISEGISDAPRADTTPDAAISTASQYGIGPSCGVSFIYPASRSWPAFG